MEPLRIVTATALAVLLYLAMIGLAENLVANSNSGTTALFIAALAICLMAVIILTFKDEE